jgi:hypothetical protein
MNINLKSATPHIVAVLLFIIVPIIYFLPAFQGMVIHQGDIDNYLGAAKEMMDFKAAFHTETLWTNSVFGGMPTYTISANYPGDLIQYIFHFLMYTLPFPSGIVFMYCLSFYILLQVLKVDPWVSIFGAFAYAFSSFFFIVISAGHNSEANAIAFMPMVLAGVILAYNGKKLMGALLTAIALALELYATHIQITYYLMLTIMIYGIVQLVNSIRKKQLPDFIKTTGVLGIAALLAVATNTTNLWLTYQYGKYSTRGKSDLTLNATQNKSNGLSIDYATQWSYGVEESMSLMIPNYVGGVSEPIGVGSKSAVDGLEEQYRQPVAQYQQYWGDQPFTSGPVYVGAIVCFLAVLGLFVIKGPFKWFIFIATILSVMLSWGKNFMSFFEIFFYHFPGFDKFRSVSMILVIAELMIPLLAALTLDNLIKDQAFLSKKINLRFFKNPVSAMKVFIAAFALTGGISLLCFIMPTAFSDFQKHDEVEQTVQEYKRESPSTNEQQVRQYFNQIMPYVIQARKKVFTSDAIRTAIFILLAAALLWVYYKKFVDKKVVLGVLLFFLIMDMYNVDKRYLNDTNFKSKGASKEPFQPDQADQQIMQDQSPDYRVFNTTIGDITQDGRTSYFHKSLGGYSGAKMKRYDELIPEITRGNMAIIDMLNTKYFIVGGQDGQTHAQMNPGALGNAWFVDNYKLVPNADSEYTNLSHFDPSKTAIVNQEYSAYLSNKHFSKDTTGFIKLDSYEPNDLKYSTQAHSEQLAVFSEIYYKDGWDAYIDGAPTEHIRVNYILRAMIIPSGNHKIEFKFEPKAYAVGEKISFASSLLLILACLGFLAQQFMKKPKEA